MSKKTSKPKYPVKFTKAQFTKPQIESSMTNMAGLRPLIREFAFVANSVGQAFQREFEAILKGRIKIKGRKSPILVEIPPKWCVAVDIRSDGSERRVKGSGSKFLKALQAKSVFVGNTSVYLRCEILTYFASKLITSQDQKFEGGLMARIFRHLENDGELTLETLSIGDKSYTREELVRKRDDQLHYLKVLEDAGIAKSKRRESRSTFDAPPVEFNL